MDAFLAKGNRPFRGLSGDEEAVVDTQYNEAAELLDRLAALQMKTPKTKGWLTEYPVTAQNFETGDAFRQVVGDFRNGRESYYQLMDPDSRQSVYATGDDFLHRYHKQFNLPDIPNAQIVIGPGYLPAKSNHLITDTYKGRPVRVVGYTPNKAEVLVVFPDDPASFRNPQRVPFTAMATEKELPIFYQSVKEAADAPDLTRRPKTYKEPVAHSTLLQELQALIDKITREQKEPSL